MEDLGGRFVMPGIVDPHVHLIPAGLALARPNLGGADSRAAFEAVLRDAAQKLGPDAWLIGALQAMHTNSLGE